MELVKSHGLGNDYLVLCTGESMSADWAKSLCDRHIGLGGDGVLEPFPTNEADYGVRIWNPDGSVAEKSGNGLRIFARWLVDERNAPPQFSIWTGACLVQCDVRDEDISIEMGRPRFTPTPEDTERVQIQNESLEGTFVDIGNPHFVMFTDNELDALPWRDWGSALEIHPRFPNRTNVQFARILTPEQVEIRIWERGAGETSASGSSSCAVVAAGVKRGFLEPTEVLIHMPGGQLKVSAYPDTPLLLTGPVEVIGRFTVDPEWLEARRMESSQL